MRQRLVFGNWKMNKTRTQTEDFLGRLLNLLPADPAAEVAVFPPFTALETASRILSGTAVALGAQNMHWEDAGAYTGEIAAEMLTDLGVGLVLLGHSERRQLFGERDQEISRKLSKALAKGLRPVLCIGETLAERETGRTGEVLDSQLAGALKDYPGGELILAYEPVWAIGTGINASPADVREVTVHLRQKLTELLGEAGALTTPILYGGSVKPENIKSLLSEADIDGALVGGASLDAEAFKDVVNNCQV